MDSQFKPGFDGSQAPATRPPPAMYANRAIDVSSSTATWVIIVRGVAVVLTFISAIVMGVAKQTKTVMTIEGVLTGTAKFSYSGAYIYFVVVNVLVFVYSAAAFAISVINRANSSRLELPFCIADLVATILLYSSNSAAANTSVIAKNGIDNFGWGKFCNIADKFCGQVTAAIVLSMFAAVAYLLLVVFAIIGLHKRANY